MILLKKKGGRTDMKKERKKGGTEEAEISYRTDLRARWLQNRLTATDGPTGDGDEKGGLKVGDRSNKKR